MKRIDTIEQLFVHAYLKKLNEAEEANQQYITSHVLERDDYSYKVGYLSALREMKEEVKNLLKAHFPNE